MMKFICKECKKDIIVQTMIGTVPPHIELSTFCSDECLDKAAEKAKNNVNDN